MKTMTIAATLAACVSGLAMADNAFESAQFAGNHVYDMATQTWSSGGAWSNFTGTAYDSTNYSTSGATGYGVGATSSTDLNSIYGDDMVMAGTGTLDSFQFAIFCSSSSTGALVSAVENISFYDGATGTAIGGFQVTLGALAKGYFSVITVTGLSGLGINLASNDVVVTQKLSSVVGASRMGTVFGTVANAAPAVGTTPAGLYISNATSTAGYYTFTGYSTNSNGVYQVGLVNVPAPGALALLGVAGLVGRRRRA
jgi:hypothetical protein